MQASVGRVIPGETGARSSGEGFCSLSGLSRNQVCQEARQIRRKFSVVQNLCPFSSPESALILVSAKNRDLWDPQPSNECAYLSHARAIERAWG